MSNNEWYGGEGWYQPLKKPAKPSAKKPSRKRGWTTPRIIGCIVIVLLLIVGTSLAFANGSAAVVFRSGDDVWGFGDGDKLEDLPDDKDEFFNNYYTSTDTDAAKVDIPLADLTTDFRLNPETATDSELTLQQLYSRCAPSVVAIYGYVDGKSGFYWGTGVVLSDDGLILTNTHVLEECSSAVVKLFDNSEYDATLVGADAISDIAVLKINATGLTPARFGTSANLSVGDRVAAIGNPLGENFRTTMTDGIISAIERGINYKGHSMTLLQTNTAINEGNSGGPLFNMYGQVVGITNMKMISMYSSIEGIGFAIPSSTVATVVNSLVQYGEVRGRPSIGITVGAIPQTAAEKYGLPEKGLYVSAVQPGSDAEKQGIQPGDVILQVNYQPVTTTDEINAIKNTLEVGDVMIFTVWRDGQETEYAIALMDTNDLYD